MGDAIAAAPTGDDNYDKWRAREDMRTVLEAARIKKDATRMKHVRRCAKEELAEQAGMKALASGT